MRPWARVVREIHSTEGRENDTIYVVDCNAPEPTEFNNISDVYALFRVRIRPMKLASNASTAAVEVRGLEGNGEHCVTAIYLVHDTHAFVHRTAFIAFFIFR